MDFEIEDLIENDENQGSDDEGKKNRRKAKNGKDSADVGDEGESTAKPAVKRKQAPRVTLNAERLCGDRGIAQLPTIFSQIKFQGKGNEKQDLEKLLKTMEHWSHRLFPRLRFDDVVDKIEVLGTKRPVQTCLRKMRLDMPVLSSDFVSDDTDPKEAETNDRDNVVVVDDDLFDTMFGSVIGDHQPTETINLDEPRLQTDNQELNEEQRERIALNRRLALEKRSLRAETQTDEADRNLEDLNTSSEALSSQDNVPSNTNQKTNEWLNEDEMLDLMEQED